MSSSNNISRPTVGFARPMGVGSPMNGPTYDGKELQPGATRTTREVPTRVGARLHYRDGRVTDLDGLPVLAAPEAPAPAPTPCVLLPTPVPAAPTPALTTPPAIARPLAAFRPAPTYTPPPGSKSAEAIAVLKAMGRTDASLSAEDTLARFGVPRAGWKNYYKAALAHGFLQIVQLPSGQWAIALPTWAPVAATAVSPPAQPTTATPNGMVKALLALATAAVEMERMAQTFKTTAEAMWAAYEALTPETEEVTTHD